LSGLLDAQESARARKFVHERDARRFVAGRGRMREILSLYTGQPAGTLDIGGDRFAKPRLSGGPAFNLSHSGGWAALAVVEDNSMALGVDIELVRPVDPALFPNVLSEAELAELQRLPPAARQRGFFNAWTRKEATLKATGEGLDGDIKALSVSLSPDKPARLLAASRSMGRLRDWRLHAFSPGQGFTGAIAAMTRGLDISVRHRD